MKKIVYKYGNNYYYKGKKYYGLNDFCFSNMSSNEYEELSKANKYEEKMKIIIKFLKKYKLNIM